MNSLGSLEEKIQFEIWGNYYELVLNDLGMYNLYRIYDDKNKKKFNVDFDASFDTMADVRKYVLNHDMDFPEIEEVEKQEINAGARLTTILLLSVLFGFIIFVLLSLKFII